ncbi:serine/arginine-rich splicing factor SR45a isoform X1 [Jatropha curcas]|uniref:serine/arginine-rich splicing factor SR45a isoform X1 n=1 Tax=Jatropha curcas TaxID=180498 RepID=UPI0009D65829|nr:serine/arginine-rich splicing factor SR45a isoform X1 [Jatropha curcas]
MADSPGKRNSRSLSPWREQSRSRSRSRSRARSRSRSRSLSRPRHRSRSRSRGRYCNFNILFFLFVQVALLLFILVLLLYSTYFFWFCTWMVMLLFRSRSRSRGRPDAINPGNTLYVTGLSTRVTERDLEEHFSKEGKVASCFLVVEPRTRISRGFAFVTMDNVEAANRCVKHLNQSVLEGRYITVEKSRRKRARTPTPGHYLGLKSNRDYGYRGDRGRYRDRGRDEYRRSPRRSPYRGGHDYSPRHSPYAGRSRRDRSRSPYSPPYHGSR